uniref:Uncharacterized protein n=1 Tax=Romanomermis culicivorax TaxID=13658 RepID=A0A915J272_ROMCU
MKRTDKKSEEPMIHQQDNIGNQPQEIRWPQPIPPPPPAFQGPLSHQDIMKMEEVKEEELPELESDEEQEQVMQITEMNEETFIWTKSGTW